MNRTREPAAVNSFPFQPVTSVRSLDHIVDQIETAIISGELRTGDRLPSEPKLCQIFNVGRPTLREALRVLEARGLIATRTGSKGGTFVVEPGPELVANALRILMQFQRIPAKDLTEMRLAFEGENARLAALRATESDLREIESTIERLDTLSRNQEISWEAIAGVDVELHQLLARASHNAVRVAIMDAIYRTLAGLIVAVESQITWEDRLSIADDHRAIYNAIVARDPDTAESAIRTHVEWWGTLEVDTAEVEDTFG
jgi:GntR family transcriptional repressor for pyruvate dehydrogenase complex